MRVLATVPTYNESGNVERLILELLELRPDFEVLVIDDHSPDGTWQIVETIASANPRVHLLHRKANKGRGTSGRDGFIWAVAHGAEFIVEMDADFSHHPRFIPAMLEAAERGADVVVGSRLVKGGGEVGRDWKRRAITHLANFYIRSILRLPVRDCTSGFRVFRGSLLSKIPWERVESQGPEIVQEVLLWARALGAKMVEVPILFEERAAGQSTFNMRIARRSLASVLRFRFKKVRL